MKRLLGIILSLLMAVSLCACGGNQEAPVTASAWQEHYELGIKYLSDGNYEEAIISFTAAIEIEPNRIELYTGRAQAYILSRETADNLAAALADYEKALELDEALAEGWLGLADVYIRMGDYDKALEVLKEGLEKTDGDASIADKIAEMESGNISDSGGKPRRTSGYDEAGALVWYWDHTYDETGRDGSLTAYRADGSVMNHIDFVYDANGNKTTSYSYSPHDGMINRLDYTYDADGNTLSEIHYEDDNQTISSTTVNAYEGDLLMTRTGYDADGEVTDVWKNQYDSQNRRIRADIYDSDGELQYYQTWEYNERGSVSIYSSFGADGELHWYHENQYDDQGNYVGYDDYDGEGNLTVSIRR